MTNTALVRRWFDGLWNQGNEAIIDEIVDPQCRVHGLGPEDIIGPEGFREFYRSFRASFPTVHIDIEDVLEGGDRVALRARAEVFDNAGRGPFHFTGGGFIRIENGRFVEAWNEWNFLNLLTEMGAIPADAMEVALVQAAAVPT